MATEAELTPEPVQAQVESNVEEGGAGSGADDLDESGDVAAAAALLAELDSSHAEVRSMLQAQAETAAELGSLKEQLTAELAELEEESWRLQAYNELELMKKQLDALQNLEFDLDAAEALLDAGLGTDSTPAAEGSPAPATTEQPAGTAGPVSAAEAQPADSSSPVQAASNTTQGAKAESNMSGDNNPDNNGDSNNEYDDDTDNWDIEDVAALQAKLDQELADMFAQLQAVRNEAQSVSARKAALEAELKTLLEMQADLGEEGEEGSDDLTVSSKIDTLSPRTQAADPPAPLLA